MNHASQEIEIVTEDGYRLEAECFLPVGAVAAKVIIHPAMATPAGYYRAFAGWLADRKILVLTYDLRGIGASRPKTTRSLRGFSTDLTTWAERDAVAAHRHLERIHPELPLFVVGHSFGGQIALAMPGRPRVDALLTVGAQNGYWRGFPWRDRGRMWTVWHVLVPALTRTFGYVPSWTGIGEDLPAGAALQWKRWCQSPSYYLDDHPEYAARLAAYHGPVLALSFSDDEFATRASAQWLVDRFSAAEAEHRHLLPQEVGLRRIGHFGFFRRSHADALWPHALEYFEAVARGRWKARMGAQPALRRADIEADLNHGRA